MRISFLKEAVNVFLAFLLTVAGSPLWASSHSGSVDMLLDGSGWRMGSFPAGAGEKAGVFALGFDDGDFPQVSVPGDTQLQAGFAGVDRFRDTKDLIAVNEKEWWYRRHFTAAPAVPGMISRIVFDGSDYFTTVWLNGHLLGTHQGTYTSFSFDVTGLLHYGSQNVLAVKVTHPWVPKDRGLEEYVNGDFSVASGDNIALARPPYFIDVSWDALPAQGNAAFDMGIWRSVHLVTSSPITISDLHVETKDIAADGSAILQISATVENSTSHAFQRKVTLFLKPSNFQGAARDLPPLTFQAKPGETTVMAQVRVAKAHLWWSWDRGQQNIYELRAGIAPEVGFWGDQRSIRFGIRTITQASDMSYRLNGQRLFIKGSWFPIEDYYRSTPTYQDYDRDLRLFRDANFNMLVNFTVVEKPAFYDLCDDLGILVVEELPFPQPGPLQVLDKNSPRKEPFLKQARLQASQIVTANRNHPSIIEWALMAEAHAKEGGGWGFGSGISVDQAGYDTFASQMHAIVARLAPGAIFHPSLCDLGEQHFWMAAAGQRWQTGSYQEHFNVKTGFVSEFGSISMSSYENLDKYLTPSQQWDAAGPKGLRWLNLPIDTAAYAYWTSFMDDGLYSMLYRTEHFIDHDPRSVSELVSDTQLYQAFLMKYAAEAYRREKYGPIMGMRSWDFLELAPGFRFGIVDYDRVPKIAYWYLKKAQAPVAISFAYKDALESQLAGSHWSAPIWVINDLNHELQGTVHAELLTLGGKVVLATDFAVSLGADSKTMAGVFSLDLPQTPGVYMLRSSFKDQEFDKPVTEVSFIKVVSPAFSGPHRVLLIAQKRYAGPIAKMLHGMGIDVDVYDEDAFTAMAGNLRDGGSIRTKYDVIWLGCFESLSKVLPPPTARALQEAVRLGTGFIYTGGDGSFHGGDGHAAVIEGTALNALLPVSIVGNNDLVLGPHSLDDTPATQHSIRDIAVLNDYETTESGLRKTDGLLHRYGLPGFNQVGARSGSHILMTIAGQPLLVTGSYGSGKVVVFTGFTPADDAFSILPLDQEFIAEPSNRAYFVTFAELLQYALPGIQQPTPNLLSTREAPLFQTLKQSPETQLALSKLGDPIPDGKDERFRVRVTNRGGYAHLVHLRADWSGSTISPYLTEFSDNDFELLPNEAVDIELHWRGNTLKTHPRGLLIAGAANAKESYLQF